MWLIERYFRVAPWYESVAAGCDNLMYHYDMEQNVHKTGKAFLGEPEACAPLESLRDLLINKNMIWGSFIKGTWIRRIECICP